MERSTREAFKEPTLRNVMCWKAGSLLSSSKTGATALQGPKAKAAIWGRPWPCGLNGSLWLHQVAVKSMMTMALFFRHSSNSSFVFKCSGIAAEREIEHYEGPRLRWCILRSLKTGTAQQDLRILMKDECQMLSISMALCIVPVGISHWKLVRMFELQYTGMLADWRCKLISNRFLQFIFFACHLEERREITPTTRFHV